MEQLLKDLNARRDRARLLMFSCLILYIPALVLLFKGNAAAGAAASVLGFGVYLFVAKREEKRYAAAVAEANALRGVAAPLENAEYAARSECLRRIRCPCTSAPPTRSGFPSRFAAMRSPARMTAALWNSAK